MNYATRGSGRQFRHDPASTGIMIHLKGEAPGQFWVPQQAKPPKFSVTLPLRNSDDNAKDFDLRRPIHQLARNNASRMQFNLLSHALLYVALLREHSEYKSCPVYLLDEYGAQLLTY